ncbi:35_t:CDS:2, partial [Dentiscutata heterogama]
RPRHPIWSFFNEGEEIDSGHHSVFCNCDTSWKRGKPSSLEWHILVECKTVDPHVKEADINNYFESLTLSNEQKANLDISLIKLFVCGGLSWRLVDYSFFVKFVQQLRPAYNLPVRKTLASTLLDNEILR